MNSKFKITITAKIFSILAVITLFSFIMGIYSFISTKNAGQIASDISNVYVDLFDYNNILNSQIADVSEISITVDHLQERTEALKRLVGQFKV